MGLCCLFNRDSIVLWLHDGGQLPDGSAPFPGSIPVEKAGSVYSNLSPPFWDTPAGLLFIAIYFIESYCGTIPDRRIRVVYLKNREKRIPEISIHQ